MPVKVLHAGMSKPGGRKENQDYQRSYEMPLLWQFIVADGLGGQGGGSIASTKATQKMLCEVPRNPTLPVGADDYFSLNWLTAKFEHVHTHIKEEQSRKQELAHMATTMVVLMLMGDKAIWGHVGDSRLYLFRAGAVHYQTKDHSVPQMLAMSGEIAEADIRHHPERSRLLRALGDSSEHLQAHVYGVETLQLGDVFLLCTDGFWEYVLEREMLDSLYQVNSPHDWLLRMETEYLQPAVEQERIRCGQEQSENDNYTALAVWYGAAPSLPQENTETSDMRQPIFPWFANLKQSLKKAMEGRGNEFPERKRPTPLLDPELEKKLASIRKDIGPKM